MNIKMIVICQKSMNRYSKLSGLLQFTVLNTEVSLPSYL